MLRCLRLQTNRKHNNSFSWAMEEVRTGEWRRRRWETHKKEDEERGKEEFYAGRGHFWIDADTALEVSLYKVSNSVILKKFFSTHICDLFYFIFMRLSSVICSLVVRWGQWIDTAVLPLPCIHFPWVNVHKHTPFTDMNLCSPDGINTMSHTHRQTCMLATKLVDFCPP